MIIIVNFLVCAEMYLNNLALKILLAPIYSNHHSKFLEPPLAVYDVHYYKLLLLAVPGPSLDEVEGNASHLFHGNVV